MNLKLNRLHQVWIDQRLLTRAWCLAEDLYGTAAATFAIMKDKIPGALAECGVAAGVHPAVMHYCMRYTGEYRPIYLFDSFEGIPRPTRRDAGGSVAERLGDIVPDGSIVPSGRAAVPLEDVRKYMAEWGACERDLRYVKGWFQDTLAKTDTGPIALLRLDADLFESTLACMDALYPRVSSRGFVIVHDYELPGVRGAVCEHIGGIPTVEDLPGTGPVPRSVYWRKP